MKITDKIKSDSRTIRAQYVEPANWDNKETLTWQEFIDKVQWDKGYVFMVKSEPIYGSNSLLPDKWQTEYYFMVDGKPITKRKISEEVFLYWFNKNQPKN